MKLTIAAAFLWIALIYHEVIEKVYAKLTSTDGDSVMKIEQRAELALHSAFYGPAVATLLGFHDYPFEAFLVSVYWAWACVWYARKLADIIQEMEAHEASVHWRKTAGMIRDIVKSEVAKGVKAAGEKSPDCK